MLVVWVRGGFGGDRCGDGEDQGDVVFSGAGIGVRDEPVGEGFGVCAGVGEDLMQVEDALVDGGGAGFYE